jgi:hypothetical protein
MRNVQKTAEHLEETRSIANLCGAFRVLPVVLTEPHPLHLQRNGGAIK